MKLVRKGLNLIIFSFVLVLISVGVLFGGGFVQDPKVAQIMMVYVPAALILLSEILTIVGLNSCRKGGSRWFGLAFWVTIAMLAMSLVNAILLACGVVNQTVTIIAQALEMIVSIGSFYFESAGCAEVVPEMKTRSIVTMLFQALGYILMFVFTCLPQDPNNDGVVAVLVFGCLLQFVGCILFIVLIVKTRNRIKA